MQIKVAFFSMSSFIHKIPEFGNGAPSDKDDPRVGNQDHDPKVVEYWSNVATTSGNLRIRLRRRIKLGLWRAVVGGSLALKRILDLVVSGCALALLSPVFLMT